MLHRLWAGFAGRRVRAECDPDEPACAANFGTRGYCHHVRGADTPPCCRRRIVDVLEAVAGALDGAGVPWFAFWGTFLGAVRHAGPIPWDRDADVVVLDRDRGPATEALHALARSAAGVALRRTGADAVRVCVSEANRVGVDVELWREEGDLLVHGGTRVARRLLEPIRRWPFGRLCVPAPARTDALLQLYGPECLRRGFRSEQRFGNPWVGAPLALRPT